MLTFKNVLLITVDSLRADRLSVYGHKIDTPNFEELTKQGYLFYNAFANSPGTPSSFPAILTSTYPMMYKGYGKVTSSRPYLPKYLKDTMKSEVITIGVNSNVFLSRHFGYSKGFDVFFDGFYTSRIKRIMSNLLLLKIRPLFGFPPYLNWIKLNRVLKRGIYRTVSQEKRFFAWIHYMDVHVPYLYNSQLRNIIKKRELKKINNIVIQVSQGKSINIPEDFIEQIKYLYDEGVVRVDNAIGDILDFLEKNDLLDDTLLIVTSDHGEEFMEHGGLCHMPKLYRELVHIPLIVSNPILSKKRVNALVDQLDIAPTIADAFGIPFHPKWLGRSILNPHRLQDKIIISEVANSTISADVDESLWKITIRNKQWSLHYLMSRGTVELYDLTVDPYEFHNVASDYPRVVNELIRFVYKHITHVNQTNLASKLDRVIKHLKLTGKI